MVDWTFKPKYSCKLKNDSKTLLETADKLPPVFATKVSHWWQYTINATTCIEYTQFHTHQCCLLNVDSVRVAISVVYYRKGGLIVTSIYFQYSFYLEHKRIFLG